jgi:hypothetical protein
MLNEFAVRRSSFPQFAGSLQGFDDDGLQNAAK